MVDQLKFNINQTIKRYELLLSGSTNPKHSKYAKAYLNHMQLWTKTNKIVVHTTSKKLLLNPELYAAFNIAVACITTQTPRMVKSKQSISSFKMMKNNVLGTSCYLRNSGYYNFCYKWAFLAASCNSLASSKPGTAIGLDNVFVFELDQYDYTTFEPLPGLDIHFDKKPNADVLKI